MPKVIKNLTITIQDINSKDDDDNEIVTQRVRYDCRVADADDGMMKKRSSGILVKPDLNQTLQQIRSSVIDKIKTIEKM